VVGSRWPTFFWKNVSRQRRSPRRVLGPTESQEAIWERSLLKMLNEAGFVDAKMHGWTGYRTSSCTQGGLITARKGAT
jgi:hypothetical protein